MRQKAMTTFMENNLRKRTGIFGSLNYLYTLSDIPLVIDVFERNICPCMACAVQGQVLFAG